MEVPPTPSAPCGPLRSLPTVHKTPLGLRLRRPRGSRANAPTRATANETQTGAASSLTGRTPGLFKVCFKFRGDFRVTEELRGQYGQSPLSLAPPRLARRSQERDTVLPPSEPGLPGAPLVVVWLWPLPFSTDVRCPCRGALTDTPRHARPQEKADCSAPRLTGLSASSRVSPATRGPSFLLRTVQPLGRAGPATGPRARSLVPRTVVWHYSLGACQVLGVNAVPGPPTRGTLP